MENMPKGVDERVKMQHGRLLAIWQAHAMYFTRKDKRDVCLFSLIGSYINQSHEPSVTVEWQFTTRYLVVRACRDIEEGEELLGPWLENALPSRRGRVKEIYKTKGECHCNVCRFARVSKLVHHMRQLRDEDEEKRMVENNDWQDLVQQLAKGNEPRSKSDVGSANELIQMLKNDDKLKLDAHDMHVRMRCWFDPVIVTTTR